MASVSFDKGKLRGLREAGNQIAHCDRETRKKVNHKNPHINKDLTKNNWEYYQLTSTQVKKKLKTQLDVVLNGKPMKKTQYAAQMVTCVAPEGVPEDELHAYFDFLAKQIMGIVGEQNFIQMWIHVDEIHDYLDSETGEMRTSLPHCHILIIPAVEYETRKRLTPEEKEIRKRERAEAKAKGLKWNAKEMSSVQPKTRHVPTPGVWHLATHQVCSEPVFHKLNNAMDNYCRSNFGIPFLTGEDQRHKSVEELKAVSSVLQEEKDALQTLVIAKDGYIDAKANIDAQIESQNVREQSLKLKEQKVEILEKSADKKLGEAIKKLSDADTYYGQKMGEIQNQRAGVLYLISELGRALGEQIDASKNDWEKPIRRKINVIAKAMKTLSEEEKRKREEAEKARQDELEELKREKQTYQTEYQVLVRLRNQMKREAKRRDEEELKQIEKEFDIYGSIIADAVSDIQDFRKIEPSDLPHPYSEHHVAILNQAEKQLSLRREIPLPKKLDSSLPKNTNRDMDNSK